MYGKSTSNQRIEAWWSILRKQCADWWICLFKDLRDRGLYNSPDPVHNPLIKFCFANILQDELHRVVAEWNLHPIRRNRNNENRHGKPDVMYFTPELSNTHDYGFQVALEDVAMCKELYAKEKPNEYDEEFWELMQLLRPNLTILANSNDAVNLYISLTRDIQKTSLGTLGNYIRKLFVNVYTREY